MNVTDLVNYSTIAGALATIVATGIIINWRKQQEYSLQLSLLLDLEDKFEIYIMQNMEDFATFWHASKCIRDHKDQDKRAVNDVIKNHFREKLDKEKTAKVHFEVEVALLRVARMIEDIKCNHSTIIKRVDEFQREYINKSDVETSLEEYVKEIVELRSGFVDVLTKERNNLRRVSLKKLLLFWV